MKYFILIMLAVFGLNTTSFAAPDIAKIEIIPDSVGSNLDTIRFLSITKICIITHRKIDSAGNFQSYAPALMTTLKDVADDPLTPKDETLTEFTDLIQDINSGTPFVDAINNAVKAKHKIP